VSIYEKRTGMKLSDTVTYFSLFLTLCACGSDPEAPPERGKKYEIVVVMNNIAWDGISGSLIREHLSMPVPFLRQNEPSMDIKYMAPEQVNDSIRYARNILIVNIDKIEYPSVQFKSKKRTNKWPDEPVIKYLNAPDEQSLESFLTINRNILAENFTYEEIDKTKHRLSETHSNTVLDMAKKHLGIALYAPDDIASFKETTGCIWFSNNAPVGRTDLLVFSFPFEDRESLSSGNLIDKIDSVAKIMIPGFKPGSYMATDRKNIHYTTTTLHGKYCVIIRGLWYLHGSEDVTGPFVCYAHADEENSRVIVTEGFVCEPARENRNYIRDMEASLQTVYFPDEQ
jgi:hypothetical protein